MADQFSEWDRFYAAYQSTLTPDGAYQRYKARRKKREREAAQKKAAATRAARRKLGMASSG